MFLFYGKFETRGLSANTSARGATVLPPTFSQWRTRVTTGGSLFREDGGGGRRGGGGRKGDKSLCSKTKSRGKDQCIHVPTIL